MTCPGCEREATLVGGLCGHCSSQIASAVTSALGDVSVIDGEVVDVYGHEDGLLHITVDGPAFGDGGESA